MVSNKENTSAFSKRMRFSPPSPLEIQQDIRNANYNEYEGKSTNLCENYLYIQSKSVWKFPNHLWKQRYFTLRHDVLYFTKNKGDLIFEDTTSAIEIEADTGIYPEELECKGKKKFLIRICKGKSTHVLCSESEEVRNTFLACLLTVITQKYVVNFKCGYYKSVRLNYKPKVKAQQRHSSFVPTRRPSEEELLRDRHHFNRKEDHGSLIMNRTESLLNISPTGKEFPFGNRSSFVALH